MEDKDTITTEPTDNQLISFSTRFMKSKQQFTDILSGATVNNTNKNKSRPGRK